MNILDGLNEEQRKALLCTEGAVLVTAGAGSGKTKLLTHRIAYLIKEMGVSGDRILAITFTNKAANEMKQRVANLVGEINNIWISTFHSMCVRILRKDIAKLSGFDRNFSIYADSDMEKALKTVLKEMQLPEADFKKYAFHISACKNQNKPIEQYVLTASCDDSNMTSMVYNKYQQKLRDCNALDFDDLLVKTYELLKNNEEVLNYYINRFMYVLVDEIQDTNAVQYDLIKLLTSRYKNVFAVGDEDQCIYTWRGANFKNIFNFKNDYSNTEFFKLEQNYRSTKSILDKANELISNNSERFAKNLWTSNDEGKAVEYYEQYDEQAEAEAVVSKIYALKNNGYKYSDMAILMRLNALTLPFEQKLLAYNIPHRIYGGFRFYERVEIKNVIAYLRLFVNPKDDMSLIRIINFPKRAIGDAAVAKISQMATENKCSLLEMLEKIYNNSTLNSAVFAKIKDFMETYINLRENSEKLSLDKFVDDVITSFGIKNAYKDGNDADEDKVMNLDTFVNSIALFTKQNPDKTLGDFLESITLESDIDHMDETDQVTIATIHAVKGLEFKVVFVIGLEEGIFPLSRAVSKSEQEEERRLMYVAMTRAQERLFLSNANTRYMYGKRSYTTASRFIGECGLSRPRKQKVFEDDYGSEYSETKNYFSRSNTSSFTKSSMPNFNIIKPTTNTVNLKQLLSEDEEVKPVNNGKYSAGQKVSHPKFGTGVIKAIIDDGMCGEIDFEGIGVKTLMLNIAPLTILN